MAVYNWTAILLFYSFQLFSGFVPIGAMTDLYTEIIINTEIIKDAISANGNESQT